MFSLFLILLASVASGIIVGIKTTWYFGISAFFMTHVVLMWIVLTVWDIFRKREG